MNHSPATRTIRIQPGESRSHSYDVTIGPGILPQVGPFIASALGAETRVIVIRDAGVPERFAHALLGGMDTAGLSASEVVWSPDESVKTLNGAARLLEHLARARCDRRAVIVAMGGGITGDVAGFVAAVYQRGIAWINCPCTLLAMVDSAVGGKTGVNLALHDNPQGSLKNMIGVVHQPRLVAADTDTLASLPDRTFRSGLAECIKHGMIGADWNDPGLMDWMRANRAALLERRPSDISELIGRNVALKAAVVAADEKETSDLPGGGRMALNLGHTFAHAMETLSGLSWSSHESLQHGEAVALGLIAAARCSQHMGLTPASIADDATQTIRDFGLPTSVRGLPGDAELLARMSHDKKARSGVLRLVLPVDRGRVGVVKGPPPEAVQAGWASIRG